MKIGVGMLGAIVGDIVGSKYEFNNIKTKDFQLFDEDSFFTDDSVMTVAIAEALLRCEDKYDKLNEMAIKVMRFYGRLYPGMSYGGRFEEWLNSPVPKPYHSFGNGAAMRISAVPYFAKSLKECIELSKKVTSVTHNHVEGIKGAEATAVCIYMALHGYKKEQIKAKIEKEYYKLNYDYNELVKNYRFNETCQETVPQAIYCFLISTDFEDAIKTGISIGGDSDTLCAIIGGIAEAYYGLPFWIKKETLQYLDERMQKVVNKFIKITN